MPGSYRCWPRTSRALPRSPKKAASPRLPCYPKWTLPSTGGDTMRFLLNIQVRLPGEWTQEQRADLVHRETEAAVKLMYRKVLRRTFRVVGQLANFSIWETATPEE